MNYNEPDAIKRRIPIYLVSVAGTPVTGATFAPSAIRVSKSGGAMADSLGTVVEVAFGLYYYIAAQSETATLSYILIMATATGAKKYVFSEDIGSRIAVGPLSAEARRLPIYLVNQAGDGVPGLVLSGLSTFSKNGAAFVATAGTFTPLELGAYSYQLTDAEINTGGIGVLRVVDPSIATFVYAFDVVTVADLALANPTPASGTDIAATRRIARYTPVSFNITTGGLAVSAASPPFCLWIKFRNDDQGHVVWDSKTGFLPPYFRRSTWIASTALMTLLPDGGWQDDIEQLCVSGQSSTSIIPVRAGAAGSDLPPQPPSAGSVFTWTLPLT